jgi:V/A-type H+-transporting ATPase subunit D
MAKIRKTKTELKGQRDALRRFQKYLPTLELKKQQLRVEVNRMNALVRKKEEEKKELWSHLQKWIRLFAEDIDIESYVTLESVDIGSDNVAGVNVPTFEGARFQRKEWDLFYTPPWIDDGIEAIETLIRMEIELQVLDAARDKLSEELRITSQRVNLFEKIKIPQSKENIRIIMIALGDEQAAAVARAKIAKSKTMALEMTTT